MEDKNSRPQKTEGNLGLKLVKECPVCAQEYKLEQIRIVEQVPGANLLHLSCQDCARSILAYVVISSVGMSSLGLVTDLQHSDVLRIQKNGPVTLDRILDISECLDQNPTKFIHLVHK
ncbi:MAG: hypothetical protein COV59_00985 [Candidatus Magasanikbacteria bacterium CG11_big_fil_rev_8_21_14_0_20_39_34]|uniref:Uncharacterized protein n=1 Tax=Candidatus Magasanikbacteria bacterium CG11_big_fil_rev_8_21_14_0_20_39_34 TaxID=1974653 RepID=A0A2H0N8H3_9BACT|nr:MAG: hypothetical protein COV59_00985 [Candidatus Magasanikbacteria bacterium CG11_big_fil_rev_8_21_14_0_20_39_34]